MNTAIKPLVEWLDVHASQPNHYELLGLPLFESDPERIQANFLDRYARVRQYQVGAYSDEALRLLDHLSDAFKCLNHEREKRQYDVHLRRTIAANATIPGALIETASGTEAGSSATGATREIVAAELVSPLPSKPRRSIPSRLKSMPLAFDRGLQRLLGEENTLLHNFARVMLYVAAPAVVIVVGWMNYSVLLPDSFFGDEAIASSNSATGSGTLDSNTSSKSPSGKLAPPSETVQIELSGELDVLIAEKILAELTADQKKRLAQHVIALADEARPLPERRFVLLRKAAKLATESGDDKLIASLVAAFDSEYDLGVPTPDESWLRQFATSGASSGSARSSAVSGIGQPEPSLVNSIGMKLVLIPAGEFLMGSVDGEPDRDRDETQHPVRITRPFYLGVCEVTQQEFQELLGRNPSNFSPQGGSDKISGMDTEQFPIEKVSWFDAAEFCNELSVQDGLSPYYVLEGAIRDSDGAITDISQVRIAGGDGYRLPTEAEWEYACRAGTTTPFHFGSQLSGREANTNGYSYKAGGAGPNLARTTTVGSYSPNAFGLYDMHGNVWEWCQDWYADDYYRNTPTDDPLGPDSGTFRVLRGGSWFNFPRNARAAYRFRSQPAGREHNFGFRVAKNA